MCTKQQLAAAAWCGRLHTRPAVDRIATPTARTKYSGEGVCLGANVVVLSVLGRESGWQVWAPSRYGKGWWWVANGSRFVEVHERDLEVIGQSGEDVSLFAS